MVGIFANRKIKIFFKNILTTKTKGGIIRPSNKTYIFKEEIKMSANVETMFYNKETPWHGLGVRVEEAQSSKEAIKLAGLNWTVNSQPLYLSNGDEIPGFKANVRETDNSILGVVTDRYKIVQNAEAFDFTDALLGEGVRYETAGSLDSGKRIWLLARMDTTKICGDDVEPYLVFTNSHDGKGAIKVAMTPVRVVCQNTLTFALKTASRTWTTKHCGDIGAKLAEARSTLSLANKYMESLKEEADKMTQIVITHPMLEDFLKMAFPTSEKNTDRKNANIEYQKDIFRNIYENKDDLKKFHGTAWGLANAAADFVPHATPARMSKNYRENNFMTIVDGAELMKQVADFVKQVA